MFREPAPQFRKRKVHGGAGGLVGAGGDRSTDRAMDPDRICAGRGDLAGDGQHLVRPTETMAEEFRGDGDGERLDAVVDAGSSADCTEVECWCAAKPLSNSGLGQTEEACEVAGGEGQDGLLSLVTGDLRHD